MAYSSVQCINGCIYFARRDAQMEVTNKLKAIHYTILNKDNKQVLDILKYRSECTTWNIARGRGREANIARGEAECYI